MAHNMAHVINDSHFACLILCMTKAPTSAFK